MVCVYNTIYIYIVAGAWLLYCTYLSNTESAKYQFKGFADNHPELLEGIPAEKRPPSISKQKQKAYILKELVPFRGEKELLEQCHARLMKAYKRAETSTQTAKNKQNTKPTSAKQNNSGAKSKLS